MSSDTPSSYRPRPPGEAQPWWSLLLDRQVLLGLVAAAVLGAVYLVADRKGFSLGAAAAPQGEFALEPVDGLRGRNGLPLPGITQRDLRGAVSVVNVWAAWCPYCRSEHATLMAFSQDARVRVLGVTYRDTPENIRDYLAKAGVPYDALGHDPDGRMSKALGVRGVPTTFVLDRNGQVVRAMAGAMDPGRVKRELLPAIDDALARR
ncbi:MAG: redoxin family protein [Burkholderiales bacterium]|nr:redoxin family protein [Burkholderiales bacterium]